MAISHCRCVCPCSQRGALVGLAAPLQQHAQHALPETAGLGYITGMRQTTESAALADVRSEDLFADGFAGAKIVSIICCQGHLCLYGTLNRASPEQQPSIQITPWLTTSCSRSKLSLLNKNVAP